MGDDAQVKVTAFAAAGATKTQSLSSPEEATYDMMIFPASISYSELPLNLLGPVAVHGVAPPPVAPPILPPSSKRWDISRKLMLFVCCHASRDARCGNIGPPLAAELKRLVYNKRLEELIDVYKTSHVGGHKYAGNVLVYGASHPADGDWFGGLNASNAGQFLDAMLDIDVGADGGAEDPTLRQWWRGRMGLTKEEQMALWKCGGDVEDVLEIEEDEESEGELEK